MYAVATPSRIELQPGQSQSLMLEVTNTSEVIDAFNVEVLGIDPGWVDISDDRVNLFPGETQQVEITLHLPDDHPASTRTIAVSVVSEHDNSQYSLTDVTLGIHPSISMAFALDPTVVTSGRRARFGLVVSNRGNATLSVAASAVDPEATAKFRFDLDDLVVRSGERRVLGVTVKGGRHWFGQPRARVFTFNAMPVLAPRTPPADGLDAMVRPVEAETHEAICTWVQRPRIARWMISLLGLLAAVAVFALVLLNAVRDPLQQVIEDTESNEDVLDAAFANPDQDGARVPIDAGVIVGSVQLQSNRQPIAGVQLELFADGRPGEPLRTATTAADGSYGLSDLARGKYLIRLSGAGIEPVWYPAGQRFDDAVVIDVVANATTTVPLATVSGVPVTVSGVIDVPADSQVTLTLVRRGELAPTVDPAGDPEVIVATVRPGPDGSFSMPDVPSPGAYDLIVQQPGAVTQQRPVTITPGGTLDDLNISLEPGGGTISGAVLGGGVALEGAHIVADNGDVELETTSLSESPVGSFVLRDLEIPGQYNVTISKDGYATQTRTISLSPERPASEFTTDLPPAVGRIGGTVSADVTTLRGVTVSISGGDVDRIARPVTQGSIGRFSFSGLPIPGAYTLTFSGTNTITQVRTVALDPARNEVARDDISVSLIAANATVNGFVRVGDALAPLVEVSLSDGVNTRIVHTSHAPERGKFVFDDVAPGSYTVTANRRATVPEVRLVTVSAGVQPDTLFLSLGPAASVSGRVNGITTAAIAAQFEMRAFEPTTFPDGDPIAVVPLSASGEYTFPDLNTPPDAAADVIVAFFPIGVVEPIDSVIVTTRPGVDTEAPRVLGKVTSAQGQVRGLPADRDNTVFEVRAFRSATLPDGTVIATAVVDKGGNFVFPDLPITPGATGVRITLSLFGADSTTAAGSVEITIDAGEGRDVIISVVSDTGAEV